MSELDGKDGHEKHVPININEPTRERLIGYLTYAAPRGQGYTDFIEEALDRVGAGRKDTARIYAIEVFEPEYDADDVPLVGGLILLTEAQKADLESKLDRFVNEGHIAKYDIDRYDVPQTFAPEGVYNFVTGDIEHTDEGLRALWEGA